MKIRTNIVKLLAVLAILGSLVAIAAVPAFAAGSVALPVGVTGGPVGMAVTITATGYPTNSVLSAKFDGVPVATSPTTVTVSGTTTFTITVPTTTAGAHQITVLQDGQNPQPLTFTVQPKVTVTSPALKQGSVGSAVTVAGTGFSGGSVSATVTIGGQTLAVVSVDSTGSFTASGTVPTVPAGSRVVSAKDGAGNSALGSDNNPAGAWDNTDAFGVTPTLIVSPTSGLGGSKVTISGSGWSQNQVGTIQLKLTGQAWILASTDQYGNILPSTQGTITPSSPLGANQIVGYDPTAGVPPASTTFTVVARALTVTPVTSGPRGTQLLITGSSMTPTTSNPVFNSKIVAGQLKMGNIGLNALDITIDTQGVISPTTVYVPAGAPLGVNTIMATDSSGLVASATFTVTQPSIVINPATGPRGTSVIVSGAGWLTPSTVLDNTVTVAFCAYGQKTPLFTTSRVSSVPDGSGSFSAAITVPNVGAAGTYSIYASDSVATSNEAALVTFTVPGAAITVSPASGVALDTITVTGTGFKPYWGITVSIGGYDFPTQVFSDVLGAFTFSGQVPGLQPGATVLGASDKTSTATTFFTINVGAPTTKNQTANISSFLVRIWGYSAQTGTWSMYDPADAAGSNLATLVSGNGYWIKVSADCTLVLGGFHKDLYSANGGWNNIGIP